MMRNTILAQDLEVALALLESACSAPVNQGLVDREIFDNLADYDRRIRSFSPGQWGRLRESVLKMASLIYMTYSLVNPDDFVHLLRCCSPATVSSLPDRFRSLGWLLEHRMLTQARGRVPRGNLLRFNLNQSRLFAWHNRPPVSVDGCDVLPTDPAEIH